MAASYPRLFVISVTVSFGQKRHGALDVDCSTRGLVYIAYKQRGLHDDELPVTGDASTRATATINVSFIFSFISVT